MDNLRPPTPNMQGRELVQWLQRVYDAILSLDAAISEPVVISDHNDLSNNGGANSHTSIQNHMDSNMVHGVSSGIVGLQEVQELRNKTINALHNTITNLRHGIEVNNPSSGVHGVTGSVVGTSDTQTLTNKTIKRTVRVVDSSTEQLTTDSVLRVVAAANIILKQPADVSGQTLTIDNQSTEVVTVSGIYPTLIEGESSQELYPDSAMTIFSDGSTWRIV